MYFLGIDGGGSKTAAILLDQNQKILATALGPATNYHNLGIEQVIENICNIVQLIQQQFNFSDSKTSIGISLAGLDIDQDWQIVSKALQTSSEYQRYGFVKNFLFNDGLAGIFTNNNDWGVCLIAGTGANCYGIDQQGHNALAGDWGYLLGDQGSGFAFGQKLVYHLIKVYDGRSTIKGGEDLILQKLQIDNIEQLISQVYLQKRVTLIAKAASILSEDLDKFDWIKQIVLEIVQESLLSYQTIIRKLNFGNKDLPVIQMGSLLTHSNLFSQKISKGILEITPKAKIYTLKDSGVKGAALVAKKFVQQSQYPDRVWAW